MLSSLTQPFDVARKSLGGIQCPLAGHPRSFFLGAPLTWSDLFFLLRLLVYGGGRTSVPMQSALQRRKYILDGLSSWLSSTRGKTWGSLQQIYALVDVSNLLSGCMISYLFHGRLVHLGIRVIHAALADHMFCLFPTSFSGM